MLDLPLEVLHARLHSADFLSDVPTPQGPLRVHFPPEWPGAALGLIARMARDFDPAARHWGGTLVRHLDGDGRAIGMMSAKGEPDARGDIEIGYGLNREVWNQGYATEALRALFPFLLERPGVRRVTAATPVSNPASGRVLDKCGFIQTGTAWDPEDGEVLW